MKSAPGRVRSTEIPPQMARTRTKAARRFFTAVGVSLGVHAGAVLLWMGSSLWNAWPTGPIDVELTGMRLEDLKDLPLGAPAAGDGRPRASEIPAPIEPATTTEPKDPDKKDEAAEAAKKRVARARPAVTTPDGGAAPPRATSVSSYAPAGSRVTALMRLDRLRDTPYAGLVDALLMHLPDRRDLLEGTGVELFRDVDALLIATPNPLDYTATLLAIRHRLTDGSVRAALERGARATEHKLTWRTERGRPFAERKARQPDAPGARDHRLILLAAPHLAIVTPPGYRRLLLGEAPATTKSNVPPAPPDAGVAAGSEHAPPSPRDGGASDGGDGAHPDDWATLIGRIDAEDSVMPADASVMLSLTDVFAAHSLREQMATAPQSGPLGILVRLPLPNAVTATLGVTPSPFADIDAEFTDEATARRWEEEWPNLRHQLLSNPLIVLTGFSGLISHTTLGRDGATVHMRVEATEMETIRILQLLSSQLTAMGH